MTQPDAATWITAVLRDPETGRPFELLPAEVAFLERAFELNEDGTAKYPELVYSAPKKSGKTGFAAIVTLTATLLYGGNNPEAICAANDLEQSTSRVFSAIKKIVRASPALRDRAKITTREITFPDMGATVTAIASDAAGAAGSNAVIAVGDELWGFTSEASRRLWDELVPPPTRKQAWRLVTTYAGFSNESTLLEELYKHGIAQEQIGPDLYAGNGQLTFWTHGSIAPWQSESWLAQMRRSLRPNQYARMIENRWVTSESAFIELSTWDQCVASELQPVTADRDLPVFVGLDASLKRDSTAIVAVTTDGDRVRLVSHRVFQPSPDAPLDFEATIEAEIVDLCARFSVQEIRYDPWQMAAVAQRLVRRGAPMIEFPQTTSNLTDASSNLYELIKAGNLQVYADEPMRLSISQAVAVETPRGWRIAKEKQRHKIDVVVALAQACLAAVKQRPVAYFGLFEHYRRQSEAVAAPSPTPLVAKEHSHLGFMQQVGPKPITDPVRLVMPEGRQPSVLEGTSGARYIASVEDGRWVFYVSAADAAVLMKSPTPSTLDLIAANRQLAATLDNSAEPPGIKVTDMLAAAYDTREGQAQRPRTAQELAALRGPYANETLRAIGRRQ